MARGVAWGLNQWAEVSRGEPERELQLTMWVGAKDGKRMKAGPSIHLLASDPQLLAAILDAMFTANSLN